MLRRVCARLLPRGARGGADSVGSPAAAGRWPSRTARSRRSWQKAAKLTPLAALALFDDADKGGDVMTRLNKFGGWAGDVFKQCNEGAHKEYAGDLQQLISDTERLTEKFEALV